MTKEENTIATAFKRETMTQEEKAKAYDKAIRKAQNVYHTSEFIKITDLFPELSENENERIRQEIIEFIQWAEDRGMVRHDYHQAKRPAVWIAYLEKQKEQ